MRTDQIGEVWREVRRKPRPRDAPTTIVVLSDSSLIGVMALSPLFGLVWGQLAGARVGRRLPGRGVGHGVALARRSTGPTARWSSWWARRSAVRSRPTGFWAGESCSGPSRA